MELVVKTLGQGIKEIELAGRLDLEGSSAIYAQFTNHVAIEKAGVLVDMTHVDYIASIGMRLLISNAKALSKHGGKIVLFNHSPLVRGVLETSGLDQLIPIFDDHQSACEYLVTALRISGS